MSTQVEEARQRLAGLILDTATRETRHARRITETEREDIAIVLDELHRLHHVIATEVKEHRELREQRKNKPTKRRRTHEVKPTQPTAPPKKGRTP